MNKIKLCFERKNNVAYFLLPLNLVPKMSPTFAMESATVIGEDGPSKVWKHSKGQCGQLFTWVSSWKRHGFALGRGEGRNKSEREGGGERKSFLYYQFQDISNFPISLMREELFCDLGDWCPPHMLSCKFKTSLKDMFYFAKQNEKCLTPYYSHVCFHIKKHDCASLKRFMYRRKAMF